METVQIRMGEVVEREKKKKRKSEAEQGEGPGSHEGRICESE
jgi:hypothetical protein